MCGSDGTEHVAGEGSKLEVKGLFYGIGHQPNSQLVAGQIDLDDHGYVKVLAYVSLHSSSISCQW